MNPSLVIFLTVPIKNTLKRDPQIGNKVTIIQSPKSNKAEKSPTSREKKNPERYREQIKEEA